MPFVKLDCAILNSTIWFDRDAREVFITALLMAQPHELMKPEPQLRVRDLGETGYRVPAGWYGFVPASGPGIVHWSGVDREAGTSALERLCSPEAGSRSQEFDGRRLARINHGYLVLNYIRFRERDYTAAERSRRYRDRLKKAAEQEAQQLGLPEKITGYTGLPTTNHAQIPVSGKDVVEVPLSLRVEGFLSKLDEWIQYRRESKRAITTRALKKQLADMERAGVDASIAAIDTAIANDWQGVFPRSGSAARPPAKRPRTDDPESFRGQPGFDK